LRFRISHFTRIIIQVSPIDNSHAIVVMMFWRCCGKIPLMIATCESNAKK